MPPVGERRINIGPIARDFKAHGVADPAPLSDPRLIDVIFAGQGLLLGERKVEIYALAAVLIDRGVNRAYEERNIPTLIHSLDPLNPFQGLRQTMVGILNNSFSKLDQDIDSGKEGPELTSVKKRFKKILKPSQSPLPFLERGIGTATSFMSNVLEVIPLVAGEPKDAERLIKVAQDSYPFILRWASIHLFAFVNSRDVIQGTSPNDLFTPSYFSLETTKGGKERLTLTQEAEEILARKLGGVRPEDYRDPASPTLKCPGLVDFGGGSAIRKLWDWHLEIAERVYPRLAPVRAAV